jgi:hypothetical protein
MNQLVESLAFLEVKMRNIQQAFQCVEVAKGIVNAKLE